MADKKKETGGAAKPSGELEVAKMEAPTPTRSERLRALEEAYKGKSERFLKDGVVYMALNMENQDRICGRGKNTEEALTMLEARLAELGEG